MSILSFQRSALEKNVLFVKAQICTNQGSKLTFLLGSTGAPNFKKLGAPQLF